jgi:cyclopropane-fatty-acyl-phospholipid synthase
MATRKQIEATYNYMDELHRITFGEHGDCSGAMYDGDFSKTLGQAQKDKHEYVLNNLNVVAGDKILDIGCGWGPILNAARQRGATGIGLTLSSKQAAACRRNGLEVQLQDWKEIDPDKFGRFKAIVSIGSFEHFCSYEEYLAGKQDEIYRTFMELCHALVVPGGRLFLQTMLWGKNAPRPQDVSLQAEKGSNEYLVAILEKLFPGTWLPIEVDQIVRAGLPYFKLISTKNGRLDYIETMNQWNIVWRPSPRKLYVALKTSRYFFTDPDFRFKIRTLLRSDNRECFKREVMDHQRMVFERI